MKYEDSETEIVRIPGDRALMFDAHDAYGGGASLNVFKKGDIIAGQPALPENVTTEVCRDPVGYYMRFQEIVETFKAKGDEALRKSEVRLGEDASMGDMVCCASPGWDAYFPDATREGIIINPDEESYSTLLSPRSKSFLSGRYIAPIDTIAKVMLQEYEEKQLQLDNAGAYMARTDGPCRFCKNELFQIGQDCLYNK